MRMSRIFTQRLQGLDGAGKGAREDLAGVEQITADQDEIDLFGDGVGNDAAEGTKKVFVALGFIDSGAVCFAEVDIGGVEEFDHAVDAPTLLTARCPPLIWDMSRVKGRPLKGSLCPPYLY